MGISSAALPSTVPKPSAKLSSAKSSSAFEWNPGISPTGEHEAASSECGESSAYERKPSAYQRGPAASKREPAGYDAGAAGDGDEATWRKTSAEYETCTAAWRTAASGC